MAKPVTIMTNPEFLQTLKAIFTAKNIADMTFLAVIFIYVAAYITLEVARKQLGFWGVLAVIMYGGLVVLGLMIISLISRCVFLYQNPQLRTMPQKLLLLLTAFPFFSFLIKRLLEW
jgi:hypothetical protein